MKQPAKRKPLLTDLLTMPLLVLASVSLNVYLAARLFRQHPSALAQPITATEGQSESASELTLVPATTNTTSDLDATTESSFHWNEVESTDYRQYVANLRAVGCPDPIIRDIIQADVNQLFAARFQTIWKPPVTAYWQKNRNAQPNPEQRKQLLALDKERSAVFQELLGSKPSQQALIDTLYLQLHGSEQQLLFLPPDKREAALKALAEADFETREMELHEGGRSSPGDEKKLFDEKLKVLADVLSPEEIEEFRLRNSQTAQTLRMEVEYFDCTPEEFKTLLAAREQKAGGKVYTADLLNRTAATEEVRKLFGEERAKEFERVTDLLYINARRSAEKEGVALERIEQAWQVTRDARSAADLIAQNTSLSVEERQRQVQACKEQAEARLIELLGEKASRAVRRDLRTLLGVTEARVRS